MRDFLNAILTTIGSASLTDQEFDSLTISEFAYDQATYEALLAIMTTRGSVTTEKDRMKYVFLAKGASISDQDKGSSNIYVGGILE